MVCLLIQGSYAQDERVGLDAKINGRPVQLIFDSCADVFTLLPDSARKLGLTWTPVQTNIPATQRAFIIGRSESCAVDFLWAEGRTQLNLTTFFIADTPTFGEPSYAGIVPWRALSKEVFSLDAEGGRLKAAIAPPPDTAQWTPFQLRNDLSRMALETRDQDGTNGIIWIDTGSPDGVHLNPARWQVWKAAHPQMPTTFSYLFSPNEGSIVMEVGWADQISIGSLVLSNVPVMQWPTSYSTNDMALLGLYALRGLDFIVVGQHSVAYLRPKKPKKGEYAYNRMGALFCQSTNVGDLSHGCCMAVRPRKLECKTTMFCWELMTRNRLNGPTLAS
jgi:hypothetical protein